jgi:hypothetical protein
MKMEGVQEAGCGMKVANVATFKSWQKMIDV